MSKPILCSERATEFGLLKRLQFHHIKVGWKLYQLDNQTPRFLGTVTEITVNPKFEIGWTERVMLDTGERMTRRGWQSKRLWKQA